MAERATFNDFVTAQEPVWANVTAELTAGRKASHWMWFVFPQLASLGRSRTAKFYGLADLAEARAYLSHPVLGPRLTKAAHLFLTHPEKSAEDIMGGIDALKLRSSMTLFEAADPQNPVFAKVLNTFYEGQRCPLTRESLDTP